MKQMKKMMVTMLIAAVGLLPVSQIKADAVEKPYLSLGADLNESQKSKVLSLLGVSKDELADYEIMEVTNEEEHEYLGEYLSASVIGSNALSSVRIEKLEEGEGIGVETKNITYCTSGMYTNALTTAGVTDAQVTVAGPFEISGTAALVGVMKAYSDMTGEDVLQENADAATNELVLTGELAEDMGAEKAEQLVALVKQRVLDGKISNGEGIEEAITKSADELGIELTKEQQKELTELMDKINDLNLDADKLKQQAEKVYDKLKDLDVSVEEAQGFFDKLVQFFASLTEKIISWFSGLFG